jgi:DNA primase
MALRFPENLLEEILNRVDLVELVSSYIPLKKSGRNFKAVCPFHYEKTASFMVSPDKGIFHCFGCNVGGNAFNFLMRYEHLEFKEAVETLAKKAGVDLPVLDNDETKLNLGQEIFRINELAAEFFHRNLLQHPQAQAARTYLAKRKISLQTAKNFKLGFAQDSWDELLNYLRQNKINLEVIEKSGLVIAKEGGGYYDRFRSRVIFPIFDMKSRIIGFGARTLVPSPDSAKYINSPETSVFVKGNNLYGINFSKESIIENDVVIIVEGYTDMILPYQESVRNIVASSGTALTENQIRLLKRYTKNIIVVFDADNAGELATLRSLDLIIAEGLNVSVAVLPQGFDPDSLVREKGVEEFKAIIKKSLNLFDYKISFLFKCFDNKSIEGRARIAHEMISTINKFKDQILKTEYMKRLSQILGIEEQALFEEADKVKDYQGVKSNLPTSASRLESNIPAVEKMILKLILQDLGVISLVKKEIGLEDFQDSNIRQIVSTLFELEDSGKTIVAGQLINFFSDTSLQQIISELAFNEDNYCLDGVCLSDRDKMFEECLKRIRQQRVNYKKHLLAQQIIDAQSKNDEQVLTHLMKEYDLLLRPIQKQANN